MNEEVIVTHILTNGSSAVGPSSFATASMTLHRGKVAFAFCKSYKGGATPNTPTATGLGRTWDQVITRQNTSDGNQRITLFRSTGADATGAITFDFAGQAQGDNVYWTIVEAENVDLRNNGDNAVRNPTGNNTSGGSNMSITLPAFLSAANATLGFANEYGGNAITKGANFTQLVNSTLLGGVMHAQWDDDPQTTVDWSVSSPPQFMGFALELIYKKPVQGGGAMLLQ